MTGQRALVGEGMCWAQPPSMHPASPTPRPEIRESAQRVGKVPPARREQQSLPPSPSLVANPSIFTWNMARLALGGTEG